MPDRRQGFDAGENAIRGRSAKTGGREIPGRQIEQNPAATATISNNGGAGDDNVSTLPNVARTPTPGGPIPIPYPNIGKSSDTVKGPKSVKTDGKMPMVKGSKYSKSTGDQAGSKKGVASGTIEAECEFMMYSFDVKFEGKNVCRMGDPLFHNKKNIMG